MKGLLLFLISLISVSIVFTVSTCFSIIYYIVCFWKFKEAYKKIDNYFYDMAHSIDQFGNVNCDNLFNHILIKKEWRRATPIISDFKENENYHEFGDVDDTISYILADNDIREKYSPFGKFWIKFLNFIDTTKKGTHMEKSIMAKIKQDEVARLRLEHKWTRPEYRHLLEKTRNTYS